MKDFQADSRPAQSDPIIFKNQIEIFLGKSALTLTISSLYPRPDDSGAATTFNLHVGKFAVDDIPVLVEVEHGDVGHLLAGTARSDASTEMLGQRSVVCIRWHAWVKYFLVNFLSK